MGISSMNDIKSKDWDDKTHLKREYAMHQSIFYNALNYLCNSLGCFIKEKINSNGVFTIIDQRGEEKNFEISRDCDNQRGENKLASYIHLNGMTDAHCLLHYSPTKGIAFEYGADFLPINVQLGKRDFFGKTIEKMIKKVASATKDTGFLTKVNRFDESPRGLEYFYVMTKDFVPKNKEGDVISILSTLDGLIRGLYKNSNYVYGSNFIIKGREGPLINTL